MIQAWIGLSLGLEGTGIGNDTSATQCLTVDNGHHARHTGLGANLGPAEGLHQGHGQGEATGFDDDSIELVSALQQLLHDRQKLVLDGAAEATVGQLNDPSVELILRAKAAAADQIAIDPHLTKLVHQNGKPQATGDQQLTQQCRFTSAKKPGHHRDREA